MNRFIIPCLLFFICFFSFFSACNKANSKDQVLETKIPKTDSMDDFWGYYSDIKIPVKSGEASSYQRGENIEKSFDNNPYSLYHSSWHETEFPVTLIYNFQPNDTIDYIIYNPRTNGSNGNFKEFTLWTKTEGEEIYTQMGDYDFEGNSLARIITLPQRLIHPVSIKFVVKSGVGDTPDTGLVSCSEMEFYKSAEKNTIPEIFADKTCSELKTGTTLKDIEEISIQGYKELAKALYEKTYPFNERVNEYKPYPSPIRVSQTNKTSPYSLLDNATGIFIERGEDIVVFVGDSNKQNIGLRSVNLENDYDCTDYILKEGLNKFKAKNKGLLYIMYHTENSNAQPIKIHIASGNINGYFDISKHTNEDWKEILATQKENSKSCPFIDVLGKYAHLTFAAEDFRKSTPDIVDLIQVYDSIVWLESELIGLNKYNRSNKNRMYFHLSPKDYYMFATTFRTGYSKGSMREICNPASLRTSAIWGPAHEVGHMNQTTGFKWVGLTEVSNNVYAMYVQHAFGNSSRLATEKLSSDFDGHWNNRYEKGFTEMIANKTTHMKHADVFCKLIPFWQLELYNSQVKGNKDFYADVHEQIRIKPIPESDSEAQLQFMEICCDVAKTDFTDFFSKWGLLSAVNDDVTDHSSLQNVVNYTKEFVITQKQVDALKNYAKKYQKPDENIHYIHDEAVNYFKANKAIKKGSAKKTNNTIQMENWENVVVFEVYDGDKLIFISPKATFNLPENINNPTIVGIPAKGKSITEKI